MRGWRPTLLRLLTVQSRGFCKLLLRNRDRSRPGQSHELTGTISTVSVYVGDLRKRLQAELTSVSTARGQ